MIILERSIYIAAPYHAIDAIALDPQRLPEWFMGVETVEADAGLFKPGKSAHIAYRVHGRLLQVDVTMIEQVPGEFSLFRLEGMIRGTLQWDIEPEGRGTIIYAIFDYEMPDQAFAQLTDRLIAERLNDEQLTKSLHNLALLVESKTAEPVQNGPEYYIG